MGRDSPAYTHMTGQRMLHCMLSQLMQTVMIILSMVFEKRTLFSIIERHSRPLNTVVLRFLALGSNALYDRSIVVQVV